MKLRTFQRIFVVFFSIFFVGLSQFSLSFLFSSETFAASEILRPTDFTDSGGQTVNEQNAFDAANGSTFSTTNYSRDSNPSVTFHTWQALGQSYSSVFLKVRYHADAGSNDTYAIAYSTTGCGGTFTDLVAPTSSGAGDTTATSADLGALSDVSQLCVSIYTEQNQSPDNTNVYIRDIWIEGRFPDATGFTNDTEGALSDGSRIGNTITITGTDFGVGPCDGTTFAVLIGTYALSCAGSTWSDTSITISIDSGIDVFGGTGASGLGVRSNGVDDATPLAFYVYPDITAISPGGAGEGRELGTVTVSGNRFDSTQGTVVFENCAVSGDVAASIGSWNDTSIEVTVPGGIDNDDDLCDVRVTRAAGTGSKDDVSSDFVVLPSIIAVSAIDTNAGREHASGVDTDGLIQLNGNHLGGSAGTVEFTGTFGNISAAVHGTAEGSCTVGGWSADSTSICIEVSPSLADDVYTGSITLTRTGDAKTDMWTGFRVLPRITANVPANGQEGDTIQLQGNHFCQTGTCPVSPNRANAQYNAVFGVTTVPDGDFLDLTGGAGACNGGGAAWVHDEICVRVPAGVGLNSQPTQITSDYYLSNTAAFDVVSTIPDDPANLEQYKSNGTTVVSVGGGVNETNVVLEADLSNAMSITMFLEFEVRPITTAFNSIPTASSSELTGTNFPDTQATVSLLDGTKYHWRARAKNPDTGETSNWVAFGNNPSGDGSGDGSPANTDLYIDVTAPVITFPGGDTCSDAVSNISDSGATITWSTSDAIDGSNARAQVIYSTNSDLSSPLQTSETGMEASPHVVSLAGLDASTRYYFQVRSRDTIFNERLRPSGTPYCFFDTLAPVVRVMRTISYFAAQEDQITSAGVSSSTFTAFIAESSPTVRNAYIEVRGVMIGTGGSAPTLGVRLNSQTPLTVSLPNSTVPQPFTVRYNLSSTSLSCSLPVENNNALCVDGVNDNALYFTLGGGFSKVSLLNAYLILTYHYTP